MVKTGGTAVGEKATPSCPQLAFVKRVKQKKQAFEGLFLPCFSDKTPLAVSRISQEIKPLLP